MTPRMEASRCDYLRRTKVGQHYTMISSLAQYSSRDSFSGNEPQPNKAAPADKSEQEITQAVQESNFALQKLIQAFLIQVSPGGVEPIQSTVTDSLSTESSTDPAKVFKAQASQRPLRLLSLGQSGQNCSSNDQISDSFTSEDGGGVRGISSLVILKHIMEKIPGAKGKKPCEVFDMICGTSTGGYVQPISLVRYAS